MNKAKKGDWVQIKKTVLLAGKRASQVPKETQETDLLMWTKGTIQQDASLGDIVDVISATGRHEQGELCEINPSYIHTYGKFAPELMEVQKQVRSLMGMGKG